MNEIDFIETKAKKYNKIKIKGDTMKTFIKVNTKKSKAKSTYKQAKAMHKKAIKASRAETRRLFKAIRAEGKARKQHRLLIKQAKNTYKLSKV